MCGWSRNFPRQASSAGLPRPEAVPTRPPPPRGCSSCRKSFMPAVGMRLPFVITGVNRTVSAPISIQVDQQDTMSLRDSGVIQLLCGEQPGGLRYPHRRLQDRRRPENSPSGHGMHGRLGPDPLLRTGLPVRAGGCGWLSASLSTCEFSECKKSQDVGVLSAKKTW